MFAYCKISCNLIIRRTYQSVFPSSFHEILILLLEKNQYVLWNSWLSRVFVNCSLKIAMMWAKFLISSLHYWRHWAWRWARNMYSFLIFQSKQKPLFPTRTDSIFSVIKFHRGSILLSCRERRILSTCLFITNFIIFHRVICNFNYLFSFDVYFNGVRIYSMGWFKINNFQILWKDVFLENSHSKVLQFSHYTLLFLRAI